jgi:hypothetical protein
MKNSPLVTFLLGVLAVSAVLSVVFCALYISSIREYRSLAGQAGAIELRRNAINSLLRDTVEYSKSNSAINPILESFGYHKPATVPTNKPGGK